ncbi:Phosphoglycerate mutase [Entamoeba marina]
MKTIYIVRHGQTPMNKKKLIHGRRYQPECPLSEEGYQQAIQFYEKHHNLPITKVFTSSLLRSQLSVKQFIETHPHEILSGLDEVDFGEYESQEIYENEKCRLDCVFDEWKNGNYNAKIKGGQSMQDVIDNQKIAIDHILKTNGDVLIAMHRRAIVILLSWTLNVPYKQMCKVDPKNLELYSIAYDPSTQSFVDVNSITPQ